MMTISIRTTWDEGVVTISTENATRSYAFVNLQSADSERSQLHMFCAQLSAMVTGFLANSPQAERMTL